MSPLSWILADGTRIAFSCAADGEMRDPARRAAWAAGRVPDRNLLVPGQTHGATVAAPGADPALLARADGVVAPRPGPALGVRGSDCPGLVLAAPDALGAAHCGWRGTAAGLPGALVQALAAISRHPPQSWIAFIGPGISGRHYEVDAPVLGSRCWPPGSLTATGPDHAHLDLATAIASDLAALGVITILRSGICTREDPRLHSHRRAGSGTTQLLLAWDA